MNSCRLLYIDEDYITTEVLYIYIIKKYKISLNYSKETKSDY